MIIVSVRVTRTVKAGRLDLSLSEVTDFHFASDTEACEFGLEINSDPDCKIVGWKTVQSHSVNAARAQLQMSKDILDRSGTEY